MTDFSHWKKLHDSGFFSEFNKENPQGVLWLKIKSILRRDLMDRFLQKTGIFLHEKHLEKQFAELYNQLIYNPKKSNQLLDWFLREEHQKQVDLLDREQIVSELYKLRHFDWGGDYKNSLDKHLVSQYVKKISSYNTLISKFDSEINIAVQGYVLNSWYNHWSSIIIEDIFRSHPKTLPAIGKIKNVDFFIDEIPFDLKVTYFPAEYIKKKRREKKLPVELTFLKAEARRLGISFRKLGKEADIDYEIREKLLERNDKDCKKVLDVLQKERMEILEDAQKYPQQLALWLYENQGEMRFSSENRLFLVLVDTKNFEQSWKLKRNVELLEPAIKNYLDQFQTKNINKLKLNFHYKGHNYDVLTGVLFVVK